MKVEIWSDVACPWCYIGKRHVETALAGFDHADRVEVEWKAFQLDPSAVSAPAPDPDPDGGSHQSPTDHVDVVAAKMGASRRQAEAMLDSMTARGAANGLDLRFDRIVAANTLDAHQVLHLAGLSGVQDDVKERLFRAYFTEGAAVGDRDVLVRLAVDAGLDAAEVAAVLHNGTFVDAVHADEAEARELGITGVPFFVVDERYGVAGAQPAEQLLAVLEQAWSERPRTLVLAGAGGVSAGSDGATDGADSAPGSSAVICRPDGCAI